jgi:hypothetical protein
MGEFIRILMPIAAPPLIQNYEFFCGMEDVYFYINHTFVRVGNALLGAKAQHPLITRAIETTQKRWDHVTNLFDKYAFHFSPQEETRFMEQKVFCRTFLSFTEAVLAAPLGLKDAVLPPYYFGYCYLGGDDDPLYCHHTGEHNWLTKKNFSIFNEQSVVRRLAKLKKNFIINLLISSSSLLISALAFWLLFSHSKKSAGFPR